jgi:hypothetical protein
MKSLIKLGVLLGCLLASSFLIAEQWVKTYALQAYVGPEIYYIQRSKEGGAKQSGTIYGFRLGYDYIRRYKFYGGVDFLWARGTLEGKTQGDRIKSTFTDANIEARVGYTFQSKCWRCASFTPFVGFGYFWEDNFFKHPSPLPIHFKNRFSYVPFGFLSQIFITPNWSIGANFKVRYLIKSEVHASNDPEHEDITQNYDERLQYRAELPITYFVCWKRHSLAVSLVPFYEYRPYGHRPNFPFDFLETKLKLYGATLKFLYLF